MTRIYNLIPDKKINQDTFQNNLKMKWGSFAVDNLPSSIDMRDKMPPVIDQEGVGSCVACSLAAAFQYCDPTWVPSKLFIYYNSRLLDNSTGRDDGTTISQGVNSLYRYGTCSELKWPYLSNKWAVQPTAECYTEGLEHQTIDYEHIPQTHLQLKGCLYSGFPFVFGFYVYESFENSQNTLTGVMTMPAQGEQLLGGHAVVCVGYDDDRKVWICRNSWGTKWGDNGYFYMPYEYLDSVKNLASDFWKILKVETVDEQRPDVIVPDNNVPIVVNPVINPEPPKKHIPKFKIVPKLKGDVTPEDVLFNDETNKRKLITKLLSN